MAQNFGMNAAPYMQPNMQGNLFGGFKPDALQRIAGSLGYSGDMAGFDQYLQQNPDKQQRMDYYNQRAMQMAAGGYVKKMAVGGSIDTLGFGTPTVYQPTDKDAMLQNTTGAPEANVLPQQYIPTQDVAENATLTGITKDLIKTPALPVGAVTVPVGTVAQPDQFVPTTSGQVTGDLAATTTAATADQATMPEEFAAPTVEAKTVTADVEKTLADTQAAQGEVGPNAVVEAQSLNESAVSKLEAAQGTGIMMTNPVQREIQAGELVDAAANAEKASAFTEQVQAATATPSQKATVQGQMEGLMQQFEGGATPPWAAGAMRAATAAMAARGLSASSLAGQALIQAAMESALPIAQADAQTTATFEMQNLSNRQQRAMLAAEQRAAFIGQEFDQKFQARVLNAAKIADAANMNFTAEQQIALENSRIANTMNLTNLSNRQAMTMAEAAALAQLDMANLDNRQQAAVLNAQSFLQMDMANLSNRQSMAMFKSQQQIQALFTDQAAVNAAAQFNAANETQVKQFFSSLASSTSQFNTAQKNAISQFNAGEANAMSKFNTEVKNQREQFNAQNRLIIDQSNAQWRREIATAETAAINRANEINASALLGVQQTAYNNMWQQYRDTMEFAWDASENQLERMNKIAMAQMQIDASTKAADKAADAAMWGSLGSFAGTLFTTDLTNTFVGKLFGM